MLVSAYQHGIFPRSETLVAATRDLERDRTTVEKVDEQYRREREDLLDLQREVGLDLLTDGLLRWQDLFRPLVEASEGLEARVLVRWFDTNSFFRAPEVTGSPALGELPADLLEDGPTAATLPSPYLFAMAAQGTDGDVDALTAALAAGVLAPAVRALVGAGRRLIHLQEPWLAYFGIEESSWAALERGLGAIKEAAGEASVVLHTSFGDAAPHAERLRRLPVDAVGVDFAETDLETLPAPWGTGLVAGVLDGRRSVVETTAGTASFTVAVAERLEPTALYVSSGSDLELVPADIARRKVLRLGEVAAAVRAIE